MEILPRAGAHLTDPHYGEPFDGVRELRVTGSPHHVHLDFRQLRHAWYIVSPSVCYGFRPAFEVRLAGIDCDPLVAFGLGITIARPYAKQGIRTEAVRRYLRRAMDHLAQFPRSVSVVVDRGRATPAARDDWDRIESLLAEARLPLSQLAPA